ncbi:hypothetical protein GJAV_G00142290 [Gymnothorax javanicus]|nr:hypothetical protein GJAV_G00142290 [Gymnothorax javanicus]
MAASSTAVTVLAPNGRRQTVKIAPSTPLLQVLEDVCKKQGFSPDDYDLKFQRTVLDLTLQWRFASLPNNAKLEMVQSTKQRGGGDSRVRVALQLEDGSRVQDSFSCAQTLLDIINHFPQTRVEEQNEGTPVCIYMRDEVVGVESLKRITLKSLGLTGGSAIIRYLLKTARSPGDGVAMDSAATEAIETTPETPKTSTLCSSASETRPEPQVCTRTDPEPPATQATPPQSAILSPQPIREEADGEREPQLTVRPKTQPMRSKEDGELPGPSGTHPSQTTPPGFVPFLGGGQRLGGGSAGPGLGTKGDLQNYSSGHGGPPKAKKHKPSNDTKRADGAKAHERAAEQGEEEFLVPVDREPLVYHLDAGARRHDNSEDLPDEFFEVTIDDVRKRFAQLKSERMLLEEAPLVTKALRESRMKEKLERYPKVVVRVQFPDRHVLQGFFRPLETVGALRQFIRNHLVDPNQHFYLFIAPPKSTLDDATVTLFQANLFPAALVYFGSEVQTDSYLQGQLLETSVSAQQADEAIASCMPRSPTSSSASLIPEESLPLPAVSGSPEPAGQQEAEQELAETSERAPQPVRTDPATVPKWLKLPGKK